MSLVGIYLRLRAQFLWEHSSKGESLGFVTQGCFLLRVLIRGWSVTYGHYSGTVTLVIVPHRWYLGDDTGAGVLGGWECVG